MDELKPCPFCGSPAERYPDGDMEGYSVMCSGKFQGIFGTNERGCPLAGHAFYKSQEAADISWNRRRPAPGQVGSIRYERAPSLDKRIANGDDFAGDAYVRWVAVGHHPNETAAPTAQETATPEARDE